MSIVSVNTIVRDLTTDELRRLMAYLTTNEYPFMVDYEARTVTIPCGVASDIMEKI